MRMATEESVCLDELDDILKEIYYQKEKLKNLKMMNETENGYKDVDFEFEIEKTIHKIDSLEKWRNHLESKVFNEY